MKSVYYTLAATFLGDIGIVWRNKDSEPTVVRIILPPLTGGTDDLIRRTFPGAVRRSHNMVEQLCGSVGSSPGDQNVAFLRQILDMNLGSEFQRMVLSEVMNIPRGKVSTYGRLAEKSRAKRGARAVGNVLAMNPYPLVIPCHRVVRGDLSLGGFGGGLKMKKDILLVEGISFDSKGKVLAEFVC